jgi:hypothetical protein
MAASSFGTYLDIMKTRGATQGAGAERASQEDITRAAQVLALVLAGKGTLEEIVNETGLDATDALAALVALSNAGVVELNTKGAEVRAIPSGSVAEIAKD